MAEPNIWSDGSYFRQGIDGQWWPIGDERAKEITELGRPPCRRMTWAEWHATRTGNGRDVHDGKPIEQEATT